METITSLQNPKIKNILKLTAKHRERAGQGLFVTEGARELGLAIAGGYVIHSVYICRELFASSGYPGVLSGIAPGICTEVSREVFEKISYRTGSDGLIVLLEPRRHDLSLLELPANPFVIVLEAVEKPGNLGAILRTADAARADAVIVCDTATDIYNPNVIRSSVGCIFTVPIAVATSEDTLGYLRRRGIKIFAAELRADQWYHEADFRSPSAIVMGTEADGLTGFWIDRANARIKIPMRGRIDSLNVSVSAAVITFEAMRQRGF